MIRFHLLLVLTGLAIVISVTALTPQGAHLGRCVVIADDGAPLYGKKENILANLEKGTTCLVLSRGTELFDDTGTPPEPGDSISGYHRYRVTCGDKEGWVLGKDIALETASPLFKGEDREYFREIGALGRDGFDIDGDTKGDSLWYAATLWFSQKVDAPGDFSWIIEFSTKVHPVITLSKSKKSRLTDTIILYSFEIGSTVIEKTWVKDIAGDGIGELIMSIRSYNNAGDNECSIVVWSGLKGDAETIFDAPVYNYIKNDRGWLYINRITFTKGNIDMTGIHYKSLKDEQTEDEKKSIYCTDKNLLSIPDLPHYGAICVEMVEESYKWDKKFGKYRRTKYAQSPVYAAVTGSNVNMRDREGTDGKVIEKLNKGDRLKVIRISEYPGEINGVEAYWAYAETASGKRGWVFSHYLKYEKQVCKEKYTSWGFFDLKDEQVEFR